ncbi:type VI secretion system ATPase TssH, partial [Neisseria gonorrhoeae]
QKEYADLDEIWKAEKAISDGAANIKKQIDEVKIKIEQAKRQGDLALASKLMYEDLEHLEKQRAAAERADTDSTKPANKLLRNNVGADEVAEIVSRMTG